jgi:plasmid maintenance system antidote protein VapI
MKSEKRQRKSEVLELSSACKLVNDLMKRDGLTPDQMMKESGMPRQNIVAILEGKLAITPENASLFQRCFGWSAMELLDHQLSDLMAGGKALTEMLKIRLEVLKVGSEMRKLQPLIEKFEALVEKICRAPKPPRR